MFVIHSRLLLCQILYSAAITGKVVIDVIDVARIHELRLLYGYNL